MFVRPLERRGARVGLVSVLTVGTDDGKAVPGRGGRGVDNLIAMMCGKCVHV